MTNRFLRPTDWGGGKQSGQNEIFSACHLFFNGQSARHTPPTAQRRLLLLVFVSFSFSF
jgi:hypothetical protein